MGLDAYIYYQCPFRPNGDVGGILQIQQAARMVAVMKQHGVPELAMQRPGPDGVREERITLAQAEQGAARWTELGETCMRCPVSDRRGTPGCAGRVDYPLDEVALEILIEALGASVYVEEAPGTPFLRSLLAAGRDGSQMARLASQFPNGHLELGMERVAVLVDGEQHRVTAFAVAEHIFFRRYLDPAEVQALRGFYRLVYVAMGNRIAAHPDGEAAGQEALFSSSRSLGDLAVLGQLIRRSEEHGLGVVMDG